MSCVGSLTSLINETVKLRKSTLKEPFVHMNQRKLNAFVLTEKRCILNWLQNWWILVNGSHEWQTAWPSDLEKNWEGFS